MSYMNKSNENFRGYLNQDEYCEEENRESGILAFLLNEKSESRDRVEWSGRGNGKKLYFAEFYNRILDYGIGILKKILADIPYRMKSARPEGTRITGCHQGMDYGTDFKAGLPEHDFVIHLAFQLQDICLRTLISEMHSYKQRSLLLGKDEKEEYRYFCEHIVGSAPFEKELFTQYPVLCRCVEEKVESLASYYAEVTMHFYEDKVKLQEMCGKEPGVQEISKIVKITGDFSDLHQNGKQVLRIHFDNGTELFYKPRPMENEKRYQELLDWISRRTGTKQYSYPFLSFSDHSWCSAVEYKPCDSKEQLKRYYTRLGEQLFLAYLLGTKDLHYENIVASGEYPVLIDLESLVNLQHNRKRTTANDEVLYELSQSVLFMGILPFYDRSREWQGADTSAVSGRGGQVYPFKVPTVMEAETSGMYIGYKNPVSEEAHNRARLNGQFCPPYLYEKEMLQGFSAAYRIVMENKQEFSKELQKLQKAVSRFLAADTQRYGMVLSGSYHPELLIDGAKRELFLYTMWKGRGMCEEPVVKSEVKCLLNGDIPYFYYTLDSTGLCTAQGEEVEHYFTEPAIDILYRRLASLRQEDLEKQCTYIQTAFALMPGRKEGDKNRVYPVSTWRLSHQKKLDVQAWIRKLTERTLQYAVWNGEHTEVSWAVMQMDPQGSPAWNMRGMDMYLYNGLAGMLLLFYRIDFGGEDLGENEKKREEIHRIFLALKHQLFHYTDAGLVSQENLQSKYTGAYQGESSILYVYLALYTMSKDTLYLEYAGKHAKIVSRILDADVRYDLLYGNAGAAQVLLYLYEVTGDGAYLSMAERAVAVLAEAAQKQVVGIGWVTDKDIPPMGGMAHGNAGILMPVMQLWRLTGKEEYERLAEEIWQYENFLYDPGIKNWRDIRGEGILSDSGEIGSVAWCHGAPGILLSRIFCCELLGEVFPAGLSKAVEIREGRDSLEEKWKKRLSEEIETAYQTVNQYWARDSWSLCHGICGNFWILEKAELQKARKGGIGEESDFKETDGNIDGNILCGNEIKLLPQELVNPGIMNGYGGILYYLLHQKMMGKPDVNSKDKKLAGRKSTTHVQPLVLR